MIGYRRLKRGYRPLEERLQEQLDFTAVQSPSDPLYEYQWYLVRKVLNKKFLKNRIYNFYIFKFLEKYRTIKWKTKIGFEC